jgi:hypothetical protein
VRDESHVPIFPDIEIMYLRSTMLAPRQQSTPSLKDIDAMLDTARLDAHLSTHSEGNNRISPAPPAPTHQRHASSFSTPSSAVLRLAPMPAHDLPSNLLGASSVPSFPHATGADSWLTRIAQEEIEAHTSAESPFFAHAQGTQRRNRRGGRARSGQTRI